LRRIPEAEDSTRCAQFAVREPLSLVPCLPLSAGAAIRRHDQGRRNRRIDEAGHARGAARGGAQGQFAAPQGSGAPARRGNGRSGAGRGIRDRSRFRPSCRRQAVGLAPSLLSPAKQGSTSIYHRPRAGEGSEGLRCGGYRRGTVFAFSRKIRGSHGSHQYCRRPAASR
jgi:hypothetical protein